MQDIGSLEQQMQLCGQQHPNIVQICANLVVLDRLGSPEATVVAHKWLLILVDIPNAVSKVIKTTTTWCLPTENRKARQM